LTSLPFASTVVLHQNVVGGYNGNRDENPEKKHDRKLDSNNTDFERKIMTYVNDGSCQKPANSADPGMSEKLKTLETTRGCKGVITGTCSAARTRDLLIKSR
jgi:hypothetical protein